MSKLDYKIERLRNFLNTSSQNQLLYTLLGLGALCLIMGFIVGRLSKTDSKSTVKIDTVRIEKPVQLGGTLNANTTIVAEEKDEEDPVKPLPSLTKYKVSDWVCAWSKWTGVVKRIYWSKNDPTIPVYEVQHYDGENGWYENSYYESELEPGKCN